VIHAIRPMMRRRPSGFSLLELLLAACLGLLVWGVVLRIVLVEGERGARLARLARERIGQRRSLALIRHDLRRATRVEVDGTGQGSACPMAGRRPVLHLQTDTGPVTYSIGQAPSPIWRGVVLLRCGSAFGLYGEPSEADPLNRVLLDGLSREGFQAVPAGEGLLRLAVEQSLPWGGGGSQRIATEVTLATPP
jgi:hypothetical protein